MHKSLSPLVVITVWGGEKDMWDCGPPLGLCSDYRPTTQAGSRSIPVYVEVTDRHDALRGGLFASGSVMVQEKSHALAVPAPAMRKDDQGDYVLAVENGELVRKPVGAVRTWSRGELVEVKGLESGLTIVSASLPGLTAGQKVKLVEGRQAAPRP